MTPTPRVRSLSLLVAAALSACGGGGGGGGGSATTSPFRVASTDPADGENDVPTDTRIRVTFTLAVNPDTVDASSIRVGNTEDGAQPGTVTIVPASGDRVLELAPINPLPGTTTWSLVVSTSLRSAAGDPLGGPTTFVFRTAAGTGGGGVVLPPPSALRATAGRLQQGRRHHTATRLADTTVLLCGGFIQGTVVTDRAERYTPSTETFSTLTARMRQPRAGHTATTLSDGRILLAGGWYEISPGTMNIARTAEIFDPATSSFSDTGSMTVARADHAALRLPDGRVLVTGGSELLGGFLADHDTAEVFDPATGTWSAWPNRMSHTRATHAMVDLLDGRFLLVGGSDVDLRPETLSLATGVFTAFSAAAQDKARFGLAAARFSSGDVSVVGGEAVGDVLYFDRFATQLRNTGSGTTRPRAYATATRVAADRVLVAGGVDGANGGFVLATCDMVIQNSTTGSDTYATTLRFSTGIADHTATVLADGRVLFAGGLNPNAGQVELDGAYLYTP